MVQSKFNFDARFNTYDFFNFGICMHVSRVHLTVCTVDFTVFTVAVTVFLTFVFLNFESENTRYRYR